MELLTTWILWALLETANPNVTYSHPIGEFEERGDCLLVAKEISEEGIAAPPSMGVIGALLGCIAVTTRITQDADKPLLQQLPRTNHKRTTPG
jgi:hypothetical protein